MRVRAALIVTVLWLFGWHEAAIAARFVTYPSESETPPSVAPHAHPGGSDATRTGTLPNDSPSQSARGEGGESSEEEAELPPGLLGYALHGRGPVSLEYIYTGEVFTNMRGGISTNGATKYLGLLDVAITGDLDEAGLFPGGTVFILGEDSHGQGLSTDYVGDAQILSNLDPEGHYTQVSEYWWQRSFCDDLITVRLGKQDANVEFAAVELGGDFINSSFGYHYNIPMPSWPHPAMGAVGLFQLTEPLALKVGMFDGAADGRTWGFSNTGDVFTIGEFEREWTIGRLPGDIHLGAWYHSGRWTDLGDEELDHGGNHGVYLGFDQMLWMESDDEDDAQGLGFLFQYAWAEESTNPVPHFMGAGLIYRGLVPARDDDVIGLGMGRAAFSTSLEGYQPETAVELFYKCQLSPYIFVQPDLQFIANPGGVERDAFVAGLRFQAVL